MEGAANFGVAALVNIVISLLSISFTWWLLLQLKVEELLKVRQPFPARMLYIFLSIVFGHQLAEFFIDYLGWSRLLSHLFTG